MRRREFLALAAATPAAAAVPDLSSRICLFTDHLAGFSYEEVARMLKDLGVTGPDLTVRRRGLVAPEKVAAELPKAQAAFAKHNLSIPMITTEITSVSDPDALAVLETAAKSKITYYKLGYSRYGDLARWRETIAETRTKLQELAKVNRRLGLHGGMHNHAGDLWAAAFGITSRFSTASMRLLSASISIRRRQRSKAGNSAGIFPFDA